MSWLILTKIEKWNAPEAIAGWVWCQGTAMEIVQDTARAWTSRGPAHARCAPTSTKIRHHFLNKNTGFSRLTCRVAKSCDQCEAASDRAGRLQVYLLRLLAPGTSQGAA